MTEYQLRHCNLKLPTANSSPIQTLIWTWICCKAHLQQHESQLDWHEAQLGWIQTLCWLAQVSLNIVQVLVLPPSLSLPAHPQTDPPSTLDSLLSISPQTLVLVELSQLNLFILWVCSGTERPASPPMWLMQMCFTERRKGPELVKGTYTNPRATLDCTLNL